MMASIMSSLMKISRMSFSLPPRNSTPWGMIVAMWPSGFRLASMCWTNMRSAFLPVSGHHSRNRVGNFIVVAQFTGRQPSRFTKSARKTGNAAVVLRKGRVGEDAVEFANLPVVQNLRVLQRIRVLDRETRDVVEDHIHDADGPDCPV